MWVLLILILAKLINVFVKNVVELDKKMIYRYEKPSLTVIMVKCYTKNMEIENKY